MVYKVMTTVIDGILKVVEEALYLVAIILFQLWKYRVIIFLVAVMTFIIVGGLYGYAYRMEQIYN